MVNGRGAASFMQKTQDLQKLGSQKKSRHGEKEIQTGKKSKKS